MLSKMSTYTLRQLTFLLLLIIFKTTSSFQSQRNAEEDSIMTIPGKDCQIKEVTFNTQLNYIFLKNNCMDIDGKRELRLSATFNSIETNLFEDLPRIKSLVAKYLNFSKISLTSSSLQTIDFSFNELKSFMLFVHEDLERLDLSHNKLSNIELLPGHHEKVNIKILDMSFNILSTVDPISNFSSLRTLNFKYNEIKNINENVFAKLKNLVVLNLSFNKLSYLHTCTFCSSRNLKYLELSHNNLKHVGGLLDPLKNLKYLNLDGNKIFNVEYKDLLQRYPKLDKFILNCDFLSGNINSDDFEYFCSPSQNNSKACCSFKTKILKRRSVPNTHFHVAINNKKMFHNVSSISRKSNTTGVFEANSSLPLKDFFEKLHSLNVDNVRSFLNVTFDKVDSSVAKLDDKYGQILEKLDQISSQLDSKFNSFNETLNDMVLEITNLDSESGDILNATVNEIAPRTSFLVNDYEDLELLLSLCVFLLLTLVCLTIFRSVAMIRRNRRFKKYRMNLLNLETVP